MNYQDPIQDPITAIGDPMQDPQTAIEYEVYCIARDIQSLAERIGDPRFAALVCKQRDDLIEAQNTITDLLMEIDRYAR